MRSREGAGCEPGEQAGSASQPARLATAPPPVCGTGGHERLGTGPDALEPPRRSSASGGVGRECLGGAPAAAKGWPLPAAACQSRHLPSGLIKETPTCESAHESVCGRVVSTSLRWSGRGFTWMSSQKPPPPHSVNSTSPSQNPPPRHSLCASTSSLASTRLRGAPAPARPSTRPSRAGLPPSSARISSMQSQGAEAATAASAASPSPLPLLAQSAPPGLPASLAAARWGGQGSSSLRDDWRGAQARGGSSRAPEELAEVAAMREWRVSSSRAIQALKSSSSPASSPLTISRTLWLPAAIAARSSSAARFTSASSASTRSRARRMPPPRLRSSAATSALAAALSRAVLVAMRVTMASRSS
mmetsp:Transcript_91988/g.274506  ORF Transcript_91988/g.274506 Transcript_91988/m.274506 type:complete len:360 (+) Transcript_91988:428-1507(+)